MGRPLHLHSDATLPVNESRRKKSEKRAKASEKANGAASPVIREPVDRGVEYEMQLLVPIDEAEVALAAKEMVVQIRKREAVLEERREAMAGFKDTIAAINERESELADIVEKHTKKQPVKVRERIVVETSAIEVVRLDTGEIVSSRPAEAPDLQAGLFAKDVAEGACQNCGKKDGHSLECPVLAADKAHDATGEVLTSSGDDAMEPDIEADEELLEAADAAVEAEMAE